MRLKLKENFKPTTNRYRKVLIAGATGLVGGKLFQALLDDRTVTEIHVLSRRPIGLQHPKLQTHIVNFGQLPALPKVDEIYLALGTTIKVAGSQEAFRAVDLQANLAVAHAAHSSGARRIGLVSAVGANSQSNVFYNRVKGELEEALKAMDLETLVIAQPSLLLDYRDGLGQPPRLGEKIAIPIAKLLSPLMPAAYKPVHAQAVAQSLVKTVPTSSGVVVLPSNELIKLGS